MQIKLTYPTETNVKLNLVATSAELQAIKTTALSKFQGRVKVPGFREGNVPANVLEKHVDQNLLQSEFLEEAVEQLYLQAIKSEGLRPVERPEISISKFVPFTVLEFEAKLSIVKVVSLADYKKIKLAKPPIKLTAKDVDDVIVSLQNQTSEKVDVDRAAKSGDMAWIDFKGVDAKGNPVNGAEGKDYPLQLGSKTFIPGFEENIIGMKANDEKTFTLTFPKDYGVKALANKKVSFTVTVSKVQGVKAPKVDDDFAAKVGPFKTVTELKADIKKQVTIERQREADQTYEGQLIQKISDKSDLKIPEALVDDQLDRMEQEERQNLVYRGQTWEEHLADEGITQEQHRKDKRPIAEERIKASLVLAEVAELEGLNVSPEELDVRIQLLKGQYQDPKMQAELDKPEARRDIAGRILTEKTLEKLVGYATK